MKWHSQLLSDLLEVQCGFAFKSTEYAEAGHFLIRIGNVQDGFLSLNNPKFVKLDKTTSRFELHEGDLLTSLTGNIGRVAQVEAHHLPAALNQRVARLSLRNDCGVEKRFLAYLLASNEFKQSLSSKGHGAAQQNVSPSAIGNIAVAVPPLPEQKRIVAILDEAFEGIDTAVANTKKNLANARGVLNVCLRMVIGNQEQAWRKKTLNEVCIEFGRGKSKHRPRGDAKLLGGPYPLIQTGDVANSDHFITEYYQTYSECGLAQSKLWPKGTVCIAIVGANVAETAILGFSACFPDSVIGLVVDNELADNEYVEYLLQTFKENLKEQGKGTARDNINLGTFERQRFPFPRVEHQRQIAARLNALAEQIRRLDAVYQKKLAGLAELKQSILYKTFAGELTAQSAAAAQEAAE